MAPRRRPARLVGIAGVVMAVGAILWISDDSPTRWPVALSREAAPAAAAAAAPSGAPQELVAVDRSRGLVVLLTATGDRLKVLASHHPAAGGELQSVSLSPDRRSAYYAVTRGCGTGTIYRVGLDDDAPPAVVAHGISPAVSPDGRTLAFAGPGTPRRDDGPCFNTLVARDLTRGTDRVWRYPDDEQHRSGPYRGGSITEIAWASESRLAFTLSYEGDAVAVLDTAAHRHLGESIEVVIPGGGGDSRHPAWQARSGRLAVVNRAFECCYEDDYAGPPRTLLVDVDRRHADELLPAGVAPTWLDYDASGQYLLSVVDGRLYRRGLDGPPVLVADDVAAADW